MSCQTRRPIGPVVDLVRKYNAELEFAITRVRVQPPSTVEGAAGSKPVLKDPAFVLHLDRSDDHEGTG